MAKKATEKKHDSKGRGRLQSWVGNDYNSARSLKSQRNKDGIEHEIAKVTMNSGEIRYYVGKSVHIDLLKDRPGVKLVEVK